MNLTIINDKLKSYGSLLTGEPLFRVAWSEDLTELRKGEYEEHYNGIFLRNYIGIKRVRKYNNIKDRFIFERWLSPDVVAHPDLPENDKGGYECVYVFQDKNGKALPLDWDICQFIARNLMQHRESAQIRNILETQMKEAERKTEIEDALLIEELAPEFATKIHTGQWVTNALDSNPTRR